MAIGKFSPVYWIRLSRATAVDEAKIHAWAGKRSKKFDMPSAVNAELEKAQQDNLAKRLMNRLKAGAAWNQEPEACRMR